MKPIIFRKGRVVYLLDLLNMSMKTVKTLIIIYLLLMFVFSIFFLYNYLLNGFNTTSVLVLLVIGVLTVLYFLIAIIGDRFYKKRKNYTSIEVSTIDCENALYLKQEITKYENLLFTKMEIVLYKSLLKKISKGKNIDSSFKKIFIDGLDKFKNIENFEINNFVNKLQKILYDNMV